MEEKFIKGFLDFIDSKHILKGLLVGLLIFLLLLFSSPGIPIGLDRIWIPFLAGGLTWYISRKFFK